MKWQSHISSNTFQVHLEKLPAVPDGPLNTKKIEDHGIKSRHFMENRWGKKGNSEGLYFLGLQNHCRWWLQP